MKLQQNHNHVHMLFLSQLYLFQLNLVILLLFQVSSLFFYFLIHFHELQYIQYLFR